MLNRISDYLKSWPLYVLPQHLISRLVFRLTRIKSPRVLPVIKWFIRQFKVDMQQAVHSDPSRYPSFNAFFTRALKADLRPIDKRATGFVSPVDGTISQMGKIDQDIIFQAKGHHYSLTTLLGGDTSRAKPFLEGQFMTIYLAPRDYHRIHMPVEGKLQTQIHIPGRLFSVATHTARTIPNLFARNERVVTFFQTEFGQMAMVLVGAINVAAIETVWDGLITPPAGKWIRLKSYQKDKISLKKGEEMGRFNMGSTVILLMEKKASLAWKKQLKSEIPLKMGELIGVF